MADRSVTVTGTGAVTVVPDAVTLSLGASVRTAAALEAFDQCGQAITAMAAALRAAGLTDADLRTTHTSVYSEYQDRQIVYEASETLRANFAGIEQARAAMVDVLAVGGDAARLHGISFAISDPRRYVPQARELAMQDARERATHLAELAGASLGEVVHVAERMHGESRLIGAPAMDGRLSARHALAMEGGTDEVRISVEVEWALTAGGG